jgi:acetoin utilization protein AcuB
MKVRDVMTWNVVTVPSDMPIMEAKKIMDAHHILRVPVVDKGKLIGVITRYRIDQAGPSESTPLSVWEINYFLAKMKVADLMTKDVVTVSPDATVEFAVALAQSRGTGLLPVVENNKLIGIVTTNDFFYRILNPVLGIGEPGVRLNVMGCNDVKCMAEVLTAVAAHKMKVISAYTIKPPEGKEQEFCLHLDTDKTDDLVKDLEAKRYKVEVRDR